MTSLTQLNHPVVWCSDQLKSARFLGGIVGRSAPVRFGPFHVVELDNGISLDFMTARGTIEAQHYASPISEDDFDAVFDHIQARELGYWADPYHYQPGAFNHNDGGCEVCFTDPDRHDLEVITRPHGSGNQAAARSMRPPRSGARL